MGHLPCRAISAAEKASSHDLRLGSGGQAWLAAGDLALMRMTRYALAALVVALGLDDSQSEPLLALRTTTLGFPEWPC